MKAKNKLKKSLMQNGHVDPVTCPISELENIINNLKKPSVLIGYLEGVKHARILIGTITGNHFLTK